MTSKKTKKAPKVVPALPRRLARKELNFIYEALHAVTAKGSESTFVKASVLKWIEEQAPKQPQSK